MRSLRPMLRNGPRHDRLLLCLTLIFLVGCAGSRSRLKVGKSAEGEVVEADGFAPNDTKDKIAIKRASLVDAQRNAIEKAVGVFVSAKTLVEKAIAIENNILARTEGYVKKYDILNEGLEGDMYKTRIRALVALKDLERDLKEMSLLNTPELKRPRVMINIKEEVEKAMFDDDAAASNAMSKALSERGFVVVGGARKKEADLVISGKASAFPFKSEGLGGFVSYRARLSVQAARAGTDDTVLSLSREASGLGGNAELAALKSLETVGGLVGGDLAAQLPDAWAKGKNILLFAEGMTSFSDVERLRKHLSAQPGVADIVLRRYEDTIAQFELELGSVDLAGLASSLENSQALLLTVIESSGQTLRIKPK